MNVLDDTIDFDAYFRDAADDPAKIKPASQWSDAVVDRFHGQGSAANWTSMGWNKTQGKFDLRPGEVTIWAGINGHGKTTYLSQVELNLMAAGQKVCLASLEMKPAASMAKMTRQAGGVGEPSIPFIRAFHRWTDGRLWIYDHLGKCEASRILGVAKYVRNELRIDHFVIDSLMKCGMGADDYNGQKDFIDSLCAIARDTGLHIHLVCHMRKGENERTAPGKFDVKGAGEIADLVDNIAIVWKNKRKQEADEKSGTPSGEPDAFVRIEKQRHFEWEGGFSFWFDKGSQQFREFEKQRPSFVNCMAEEIHE